MSNKAKEAFVDFVVAGVSPAGVLEPIEAALNQVAQRIESPVDVGTGLAIAAHGDHWNRVAGLRPVADAVRVAALFGE